MFASSPQTVSLLKLQGLISSLNLCLILNNIKINQKKSLGLILPVYAKVADYALKFVQ